MPRKLTEADLKVGTRFTSETGFNKGPRIIAALKSDLGINDGYNYIAIDTQGRIENCSERYLLNECKLYEPPIKKEVEFYCNVYNQELSFIDHDDVDEKFGWAFGRKKYMTYKNAKERANKLDASAKTVKFTGIIEEVTE
jgi:hypothetical protein